MSARDSILTKIRQVNVAGSDDTARKQAVAARLSDSPRGIVPARGQLPDSERRALFEAMAQKFAATISSVADYSDIPRAVSGYLREHNLPADIRIGDDERLAKAGWDKERTLEIRHGASDGGDMTAVSHALAGIAETGTVALASGTDNPTTLNFLPEHHIVVLKASDIDGDLESIWDRLREKFGKGQMPRALNLVTGPSRSGDIEQKILLGAHGPRALHLIIVDE
ncbi:MAG: lactate utilization protein [Rhizobiales bacterium]|nr:lactate utilization protein [Hyphomicrobiales bacterium]MBA68190.1 lactate utilization protein [Hyphomicrobiales bacterium]|tara:strand:+ start:137 stop:811 length:675 start_codon:yes stop_codon:yes gene_type:complete